MSADISTLYTDCRKDLISYLTHLLRCQDTAEDIAHESFAILVSTAKMNAIDHPRGFLFKTAGNLAVDYVRHHKVVARHLEKETELLDEPHSTSPEQEVSEAEWIDLLKKALSELSPRTRDIVILHRLHGYSYLEIARQLNISESAVEKHISKGIQHCRRQLGKHFLFSGKRN
jgi:RNA polymerase sigma factor (sigma-70 family)